jgi:ribosomal protein S18 acetylase RimI-like enzyme
MIREFRPADTPALVRLLTAEFPREEAILGSNPQGFFRVVRRVYRWDSRLVLGLLRLCRKPVYLFFVVDDGGRMVATTMLTFPGPSVYISAVATDPSVRRRGLASSLLQHSQEVARRLGRKYLVLDVLADNAPARSLYEGRLGYRPLREVAFVVRERPAEFGPDARPLPAGVRPYAKADEKPLVAIASAQLPSEVARVLPRRVSGLARDRFEGRIFESQSVAFVVDRGQGPEAGIRATTIPETQAAHFSDPIVAPTADPERVGAMVRAAGAWCAARGAVRVAGQVPLANVTGRAALDREGFHSALSLWTLYRPIA